MNNQANNILTKILFWLGIALFVHALANFALQQCKQIPALKPAEETFLKIVKILSFVPVLHKGLEFMMSASSATPETSELEKEVIKTVSDEHSK